MYDSYVSMCKACSAVLRPIPFTLPDLGLPREQLATAFNEKTKFIMVNTPHNPTGKVCNCCCVLHRHCLAPASWTTALFFILVPSAVDQSLTTLETQKTTT